MASLVPPPNHSNRHHTHVRLVPWASVSGASAKNKMRTRVERREKPSDLRIPYQCMRKAEVLRVVRAVPGDR